MRSRGSRSSCWRGRRSRRRSPLPLTGERRTNLRPAPPRRAAAALPLLPRRRHPPARRLPPHPLLCQIRHPRRLYRRAPARPHRCRHRPSKRQLAHCSIASHPRRPTRHQARRQPRHCLTICRICRRANCARFHRFRPRRQPAAPSKTPLRRTRLNAAGCALLLCRRFCRWTSTGASPADPGAEPFRSSSGVASCGAAQASAVGLPPRSPESRPASAPSQPLHSLPDSQPH